MRLINVNVVIRIIILNVANILLNLNYTSLYNLKCLLVRVITAYSKVS